MAEATSDTSDIPHGPYCYSTVTKDFMGLGHLLYACPHWRLLTSDNGYCAYLKKSDRDLGDGMLWDSYKECGVNCDD